MIYLINSKSISLMLLITFSTIGFTYAQKPNVKKVLKHAESQTDLMLSEIQKADDKNGTLVSPRTLENGELKLVASKDWTSGFFPGELWYLFELTKNKKWKIEAQKFTAKIEQEKLNGKTHDMGFKIYNSFGNSYRLTKNNHDREVIIQSAKTLATRFNPVVGAIRSWDHNADKWDFPVIIDNMLNLELLFEATKLTGDSTFYKIAVSHANTTLKNHFRPDFSTWHVIGYNPITGAVEKRTTHQGFSDSSTWARGMAWALYGFTMCYRETKDPKYLEQAKNIENFIFNHKNMPKDFVPYWDFDAPNLLNEERDASAATIFASAFLEMSTYNKKNKAIYFATAEQMLSSLSSSAYTAKLKENNNFILKHSVGHKPANSEVNTPIVYADYYYLEALLRYKKLTNQ